MANNDINYLRKEVDNLQVNMKSFDVTTEYATSTSDTTAPTTGWSTSKPAPAENVFIWARNILNIGYGDIITEPYCIGDGLEHILSIDVEYIANTNPYDTPSQDSTYWQTDAPTPAWNQYIWTRSKVVTTEQTVYTSPVRITGIGGELLADGRGYLSNDKYIHLIFSDVNNPTSWNQCYTMANSHDYVGVLINNSSEPVTDVTSYSFMSRNSDLRFSVGNGYYFFIRYSDYSTGYDDNNYSNMNTSGGAYIGYLTKTGTTPSSTPSDYTWVKIEGTGIRDIIEYYARSTSYTTPPITGWSTTPLNYTQGYFYWTKTVIYYTDGSVSETTPLMVSGLDGENIHYVYYCSNSSTAPSTPVWSDIHQNTGTSSDYNRWCEDPVAVTENYPFIYISSSTDYNPLSSSWSNFTSPSLWSKYGFDGEDGMDGIGYEYAYYTSNSTSAPAKPSGTISPTTGTGKWTIVPSPMTPTYKYMYISYRTKTGDSYSEWSNPALWSQFGDKGDPGERGSDGVGMEHIFYRSKTPISSWGNNNTNPAYWNANQTDDYVMSGTGWTDDATGVDSTWCYEYCAIRTKTPNTDGVGVWGKFTTPSLWAKFGEDGEDGEQGIPGADGNNILSNSIIDKTTDQSFSNNPVGSISNSVPSDFVASYFESESLTRGSSRCINSNYISSGGITIRRQGNVVIISVNNLIISSSCPDGEWVSLFNLPSWAIPVGVAYIPNINANTRCSVVASGSGYISTYSQENTFRIFHTSGAATNYSTTLPYFVDSDVGKSTASLSWVTGSTINQGGRLVVSLMNGSTPLEGAVVYFRINGLLYARTVDGNGQAGVNINLATGQYNMIAWFDGGKYSGLGAYEGETGDYKYAELTNTTFTVARATTPTILFGSDDKGYYVVFRNGTSNYPIRYHKVTLNIGGSGNVLCETNGDGQVYYSLNGYTGSVTVTATINSSNRVRDENTASKTHTL